MSDEKILRLERMLDREKRARDILEKEVELQTRKMFILYEYHQKVFDSVGVSILHLSNQGNLIMANKFATSTILNNEVLTGQSILPMLRVDNRLIKVEDLPSLIDKDLEIVFVHPQAKGKNMNARITKLNNDLIDSELLLTMKDLMEIRIKDEEIKELQNQLVDSAYRDGVAENAVSVLHNIGNILTAIVGKMSNENMINDLNLLTSVLSRMSSKMIGSNSSEEFFTNFAHDPKARAMPKLLQELSGSAVNIERNIQETFNYVKIKCNDIAEVIAAQQNYANFKDKKKTQVSARKIVSDCLVMHKDRIASREIEVVLGDFPISSVYMEKIGLAQTLSNAIMNAVEAIDERFSKDNSYIDKKIHLSASQEEGFLVIKITDNGIGIDSEVLKNLFKFGFSTKNRSSGFGLHNCANFMNSNKGRIEIVSPGINQGATTILYCPIQTLEVPCETA